MNKLPFHRLAIGLCLPFAATLAQAHVGVVNTQLSFAREGTYELVLAIPHGCAVSAGSNVEADTYKVEVTTPAAFTGARPIVDGVFGVPSRTVNPDGTITFVWTKVGNGSSNTFDAPGLADTQSYRIALRGSFRATTANAEGSRFTTQQFNTRQYCKNPESPTVPSTDLVSDWTKYGNPAVNESPKVKVYPTRTPGWNAYTVPVSVAATLTTPLAVEAFLKAFFADAQIVWAGKAGFSANAATAEKIKALAAKDSTYSELASKASLSAAETVWVKY